MKLRTRAHSLPAPGFSLVELMIVVAMIAVLAAIGLPNLVGYMRQAKVRGAMQQVAGELQTARNKAIVKNTNEGVVFAVIDANTYRFIIQDIPASPPPSPEPLKSVGAIHELPTGVTFLPATLPGIAFDHLGRACKFGPGCPVGSGEEPTQAELCPTASDLQLCTDFTPGSYISEGSGSFFVEMVENTTGLRRRVEVAPGGRVVTQR
jgi:prepilin-type N-terminal cleavage/methylation domain-containing protein